MAKKILKYKGYSTCLSREVKLNGIKEILRALMILEVAGLTLR